MMQFPNLVLALCLFGIYTLCSCLLGINFGPSVDILPKQLSYDTSPTFMSFRVSRKSRTDCTIYVPSKNSFNPDIKFDDFVYSEPKAFGYISSAPKQSIILHTERHGALYSAHIPRFNILYSTNSDGLDLVVTSSVPDYVVCDATLDIKASIILRCQSSDTISVLTFSDVITSVVLKVILDPYMQNMMKSFLDMSLRAIILSLDLSDRPLVVVRMLRLTLE